MIAERRNNMTKWTLADMPSLQGRLAAVTGANSGIGWHTALELARAGSEVILASRTEAKGRDAVDRIRQEVPQAKVRAEVLDLANWRLMACRRTRPFVCRAMTCEGHLDHSFEHN
jgi:NAD(P)-dependent dehydrogenase (short-subunit alcohol dehydrogenase family)